MRDRDGGAGMSPLARLVDVLVDNAARRHLLITIAYVAGALGLGAVFLPDGWLSLKEETVTVASIVLMTVSFLALFAVSITAPGIENS